jgi:molybdopterin synthase catalytic subunit
MITVQAADFDQAHEYQTLRQSSDGVGAIVTFTGLVRDFNEDGNVSSLYLEHYPGMTEKALMNICSAARKKWPLGQIRVIHRIGQLDANEQIVFVGVTSAHREAAFAGAQFIMDFLKTQAPLWKQEVSAGGTKWVAAKDSDSQAADKWQSRARIQAV